MEKHIVVIGGNAAGLSAASRARRGNKNIKISVFEKTENISIGACGLPYFLGNMINEKEDLVAINAETLKKKRNIDVYTGCKVTAINRDNKTITVSSCNGKEDIRYDSLVIATGASPIIPEFADVNTEGIYTLRNLEDGTAIKNYIRKNNVKKAAIIGGGLIGLEVAEQLSINDIEVTVFELSPKILGFINDNYVQMLLEHIEANGIKVLTNNGIQDILVEDGRVTGLVTTKEEKIDIDLIVFSIGVKPNSRIAEDAGLEIGYKGGIVVDDYMRTSDKSIYSAGDCVQMKNIITNTFTYVPLGTTANKQGKLVGANIVGENQKFRGILSSQVTKVFDFYIASTGLTIEQARNNGYNPVSISITKNDKASYYVGGKENHIYLVFERTTGKILGAQAIGSESVAGRINVLVAAITANMTVNDLNELDLVYAPPVAPVYDPLLIAASQAIKKVNK
ncbi:FAD-dependent oxidoreductase [Vallitalea guaymasensis]|uniref:FAD-dependent oxidoreductase n=1 Tax=Vallitalea guaymasensis TaxID=1185412 RepID=A0A8J8MAP8_9FIRM|nr:FAD-dependent oxidoreductase [Vallitalea guaymasensis]QUH29235.1 FAD-dependent oxidoreductase [Vallitalea guaymasensis]